MKPFFTLELAIEFYQLSKGMRFASMLIDRDESCGGVGKADPR